MLVLSYGLVNFCSSCLDMHTLYVLLLLVEVKCIVGYVAVHINHQFGLGAYLFLYLFACFCRSSFRLELLMIVCLTCCIQGQRGRGNGPIITFNHDVK